MHWPVPPAVLRPLVPAGLELDTFENEAWLGIVPFKMTNVRPRCMPPMGGASAFAELNVRTYVTHRGRSGVWFFSLDAASKLAVAAWPALPGICRISTAADGRDINGQDVNYDSVRTHRDASPASLDPAPSAHRTRIHRPRRRTR